MAKVTELTAGLARPIAEENGCTLWDVEYVKEAGTWFLRVYIDKEGGVDIDDCEAVSRRLSDALDEADPIEGSYTLEVSSAGLDRTLKKPEHFAAFLGSEVDVKLYRPLEGRKEHTGVLRAYDAESGAVTVETAAGERTFPKKDVAQVRLAVRF
ncbi:MAG TPA: ribosome maturation factor RimP [Candidatus Galloscillospira excrementavium]|nr:ribosome maturation factor RimP [Candidatus Galloscillospira excrementavium]